MKEFEEQCGTSIAKLRHVADAMNVEMHVGLASEGDNKLEMLITYVDNLPSGFVQSITFFLRICFFCFNFTPHNWFSCFCYTT